MKKIITLLALMALAGCKGGSTDQSKTSAAETTAPKVENSDAAIKVSMSEFVPTHFELLKAGLPNYLCSPTEFATICFDIQTDECASDMQSFVAECCEQVIKTIDLKSQAFECANREECKSQGAALGQQLGQKVGSCAGIKFELKHKAKFKKKECFEHLRSKGIDTAQFESRY